MNELCGEVVVSSSLALRRWVSFQCSAQACSESLSSHKTEFQLSTNKPETTNQGKKINKYSRGSVKYIFEAFW